MTWDRNARPRALVLAALLFVTACAAGDNALLRQAKEECAARRLEPASEAYAGCVHDRSEELYEYWMREMKSGD